MERGEIWTLRDTTYASKARPVVVVQDESVASFDSIVLCLLTSYESEDLPTRVHISPTDQNGLNKDSYVMADKIVTVDKELLGTKIGVISETDIVRIDNALKRTLGLLD